MRGSNVSLITLPLSILFILVILINVNICSWKEAGKEAKRIYMEEKQREIKNVIDCSLQNMNEPSTLSS